MAGTKQLWSLVGFGEAMIRFAPVSDPGENGQTFLRSVGGDELNVCVDLAKLDTPDATHPAPQWVSVLPTGPLGDLVAESGERVGVSLAHTKRIPHSDIGIFTVLPELKTVHYQRRNSAFAKHVPASFDWQSILAPKPDGTRHWLHVTGITPLIAESPRLSWTLALQAACELGVPVSMDFNHRKQLGTLSELWAVVLPHLSQLEVLILSVGSMVELAGLCGIPVPSEAVPLLDPSWRALVATLRRTWRVRRLAVCFKTRDANGLQRRWSAIADASGVHTTVAAPVYHTPKDECGGGSAWAAGLLDCFMRGIVPLESPDVSPNSGDDVAVSALAIAARHADLLAAMCQESAGDHSQVTRVEFEAALSGGTMQTALCLSDLPGAESEEKKTLRALKSCGVLAILRAKNTDAAVERGLELIALGCKAIEVTLDTADWRRVLKTLAEQSPPDVVVGVGTVMDDTVACLEEIKALGGKFALSPINPIGLIPECKRLGLLAVPSGLSSNECWDLKRQGAQMIKLFHAGQVTAKILKSMLGVTPLAAMNIMPSGGVSPDNVDEWLDAGAAIVGMGSNLAGKDIGFPTGSVEFDKARAAWNETGRATAEAVFAKVAARYAKH
eukprot:m.693765 g.693765  ORF g.693765 m.693765 type:complete len:614 (+) comp22875_c0_seq8:154-1995(+)